MTILVALPHAYATDIDFLRGQRALHAVHLDEEGKADSIAMLLLSPLALKAGRMPTAARWLQNNGFTIAYQQMITLSHSNIGRIWRYQRVPFDPVRVSKFRTIMTCGPAMLLVTVSPTPPGESAAHRLRVLKGPSNPRALQPHHLRYHLGAANMFNNLVHTSDTPDDVVREMAAILNDTELDRAWRQAAAAVDGHPHHDRRYRSAYVPTDDPRGVSLAHWLTGMRFQIHREILKTVDGWDTATLRKRGASVQSQHQWAKSTSPARPVAALDEFRFRFQADLPLSGSLRLMRTTKTQRLEHLAALFDELGRALFGTGFSLDGLLHNALSAQFPIDPAAQAILTAEWLSVRHEWREAEPKG